MWFHDLRLGADIVKIDEYLSVVSAVYYAGSDEERAFRGNA
jgi:hypothetical protein